MFKPILLLSIVASLSACETINQASQCDPEKNYTYSNIELMKKYEKEKKDGKIISFYSEYSNPKSCFLQKCIKYDNENIKKYERNFSGENSGIYTIKKIENCNLEENCYSITKNEDGLVHSKYKRIFDTSEQQRVKISFVDISNNDLLYEFSYQNYNTGAIGGMGVSFCPQSKNNNPDYDFNALSFPY